MIFSLDVRKLKTHRFSLSVQCLASIDGVSLEFLNLITEFFAVVYKHHTAAAANGRRQKAITAVESTLSATMLLGNRLCLHHKH